MMSHIGRQVRHQCLPVLSVLILFQDSSVAECENLHGKRLTPLTNKSTCAPSGRLLRIVEKFYGIGRMVRSIGKLTKRKAGQNERLLRTHRFIML